jgi:hypothetical protein
MAIVLPSVPCVLVCEKLVVGVSWGKLMLGIRHWKPREADEKADGGEPLRLRFIAIEAGAFLKTIVSDRGKPRRHCRFKIDFSPLIG